MTILQDETPRNAYTAAAGQTVFDYTFTLFDKADMTVTQEVVGVDPVLLVVGTDYIVAGVGASGGGDITLTSPAAAGDTIIIERDVENKRQTDFQTSGSFDAVDIDGELNRLVQSDQDQSRRLDQALRAPSTDVNLPLNVLPREDERANNLLEFDGAGQPASSINADQVRTLLTAGLTSLVPDPSVVVAGFAAARALDSSLLVGGEVVLVTDVNRGGDFVVRAGGVVDDNGNLLEFDDGGNGFHLDRHNPSGIVNIMWFGALPANLDNAAEIQAAFDTQPAHLKVPRGTFKVLSKLTITADIDIQPDGVIDGSGITSLGPAEGVINASGSITLLGTLDSAVSFGDDNFTISAVPADVEQGDWLALWDSTANSYSLDRGNYYAGEFVTVQSIAGAVVQIPAGLFADYGTVTKVFKITPLRVRMTGLTVLSGENNLGAAEQFNAVSLTLCRDVVLRDCVFKGGYSICAEMNRCYQVVVDNCRIEHMEATSVGLDYGLALNNCQDVRVVNCPGIIGHRHGITTGALGSGDGSVVNRQFLIEKNVIKTTNGPNPFAFDFHGNTEHCIVQGNTLHGGCQLAGNHNSVINNDIVTYTNASCCQMREMNPGVHNRFDDNTCRIAVISEGALVRFPSGAQLFDVNVGAGLLSICGNKVYTLDTTASPLIFIQSDGLATSDIKLSVCGNKFFMPEAWDGDVIQVSSQVANSVIFKSIICLGNEIPNGRIQLSNFEYGFVKGNRVDNFGVTPFPVVAPIKCTDWNTKLIVTDNYVRGGRWAFTLYSGTGTAPQAGSNLVFKNNVAEDWAEGNSGQAADISAETAYLLSNTFITPGTNTLGGFKVHNATNLYDVANLGSSMSLVGAPTVHIEASVDSNFLQMSKLPTGDPGGSGRLWDNAGVVNVT